MSENNQTNHKTPGIYITEIPVSPQSVSQVATAIPAFIGYTKKATINGSDVINKSIRISSLVQYLQYFGGADDNLSANVVLNNDNSIAKVYTTRNYQMFNAIQMFFNNGGADCYIISIGLYKAREAAELAVIRDFIAAFPGDIRCFDVLRKEDEPTLIVVPDAVMLPEADFNSVMATALKQCAELQDRFTILDVLNGDKERNFQNDDPITKFRNGITSDLNYGAAYYPWLRTSLPFEITYANINIIKGNVVTPLNQIITGNAFLKQLDKVKSDYDAKVASLYAAVQTEMGNPADKEDIETTDLQNHMASLEQSLVASSAVYANIKAAIKKEGIVVPPCGAIAGVYAAIDRTRGVWKAPANVALNTVIEPMVNVDNNMQDDLNVDVKEGKSINVIRSFPGKGILVWGARTLSGNDNEWRYINVRRFFIMVEESAKKATQCFVFEPNDANTWVKVRSMLENYLTVLWRQGALAGAKTEHAFFVKCGLGETMTAQDILEGKLVIEIGMAAVRPAEFIILRFCHKTQQS